MVFIPVDCKTLEKTNHNNQTPCLEHLKLKQASKGIFTPQVIAIILSMVSSFRASRPLVIELSWFFWIVVFLSVWVIYTTSA